MPSPSRCPKSGKECFYTMWQAAAMFGDGEFSPEYVEAVVNEAIAMPDSEAYFTCDEIIIEDDEPQEPTCTALTLALGLSINELADGADDPSFTQAEILEALTELTGVTVYI